MPTDYTRIRALAEQRGITNNHLCAQIGKHHSYLNSMQKRGYDLSDETLCILARTLGTSLAYLSGLTDDPDPDYLIRQSETPQERLLQLVMQKIPEMTDGQVAAMSRLFSLDKPDFDAMTAPLEVWNK